jgi:hypothetical protein
MKIKSIQYKNNKALKETYLGIASSRHKFNLFFVEVGHSLRFVCFVCVVPTGFIESLALYKALPKE